MLYSCVCMSLSLIAHGYQMINATHQALFNHLWPPLWPTHICISIFNNYFSSIRLLLSNPFCSDIFTLLFMSWSASVDFNLGCCTSVMRWPLCHVSVFRGSTTNRHPNLEGEQVEQQTTALHHSLWRRRWAESFVEFYAHLEYFFIRVGGNNRGKAEL